ncbi:uncharacterized protein ACR2FA_012785 [Aphomia sociella]
MNRKPDLKTKSQTTLKKNIRTTNNTKVKESKIKENVENYTCYFCGEDYIEINGQPIDDWIQCNSLWFGEYKLKTELINYDDKFGRKIMSESDCAASGELPARNVHCDVSKNERLETQKMLGVETIHDIEIDKDTIINRNMKLEKKNRAKNADIKKEHEPDWSYSAIPNELRSHVEQFKRNMTECLKEVQANDKRPVKRLSPKKESPVHGECLIACVFKRNGVITNGKINKGNLISLVSKFYAKDTKLMKKLEKNLDRCIEISVHDRDECTMASQLNICTNELMVNNKHSVILNN